MRLLLTSDFFHPVIGGAERQVGLLATALAGLGHEVRVATTAQPGLPGRDVVDGVPVERLVGVASALPAPGGGRRFLPPAPDPVLTFGLHLLVRDWRPDVVHASGWIGYSSAAAVLDHAAPLVLSVRDYGHACATRNLLWQDRTLCDGPSLGRCLDCAGRHYGPARALIAVAGVRSGRPVLRRTVRAIHSVSRFVEHTVERDLLHGDPGWRPILERIDDIVPGAPDTLHRDPFDRHDWELLGRLPTVPFILFVGALASHKGLGVLLEAWARMRTGTEEGGARPPLVLIGTRAADTPATFPAGVTVLSDVPHRVVMAAWERCLFGVVPSLWPDPLPGVVREPMTRGRPVIGSDVGGIPDMITDDVNGLLVPAGDALALAAAMDRLTADRAVRVRLGEAGRTSVEGLTSTAVGRRFETLYERVLASDR
jgi:glycosyltransferase involved in cell wall biosynthesis